MDNFQNAQYQYDTGFPFYDALPRQMNLQELIQTVMLKPELSANYKDLPLSVRQELAERVSDVYIPLDYTASIYTLLFTGMRSVYYGKSRQDITHIVNTNGRVLTGQYPESKYIFPKTQAQSFSVLGEAGMGKTITITKMLDMFPQVIQHHKYQNYPFEEIQLIWLKIESPANNSPKGVCLQILSEIDRILGANLTDKAKLRANLDNLILYVAQLCFRFHIGCLVIDEIQNVVTGNYERIVNSNQMVRFLVELSNKTGVCLVFIGTPIIAPFFDSEEHLARRTRGPRISRLDNGTVFKQVLSDMWSCLPVLKPVPLSASLCDTVYNITGGVLGKMQKLLLLAAQHAMFFGEETITKDLLIKTAKMYGIKSLNYQKATSCTAPELTVSSDAPIISNDAKRKKGRPKKAREDNDIISVFHMCREKGWMVSNELINRGLCLEVSI